VLLEVSGSQAERGRNPPVAREPPLQPAAPALKLLNLIADKGMQAIV
jgi:hypothetical protein